MTIKRGLTLGKYAPLHKGHQLVIETAFSLMDEVVVMIYDAQYQKYGNLIDLFSAKSIL
jgi:cytidyltransferase-like protein